MKIEALETLAFHLAHVESYGYPNSTQWYNHWTARAKEDGVNLELLKACVQVALDKGYIPSFKFSVKAYLTLSGAGVDMD